MFKSCRVGTGQERYKIIEMCKKIIDNGGKYVQGYDEEFSTSQGDCEKEAELNTRRKSWRGRERKIIALNLIETEKYQRACRQPPKPAKLSATLQGHRQSCIIRIVP